jgi:hypothetical protein
MLIPKVLEMFEGRKVIYQEQGFLRVWVFNLRHKVGKREIEFEVEEVEDLILSQRPPVKPEAWPRWSGSKPHGPSGK